MAKQSGFDEPADCVSFRRVGAFLPGAAGAGLMVGFIITIVMGGIIGWLASKVMNRDASMGILANVVVGCAGSILGRVVIGGLLGGGSLRGNAFDPATLLTAFIGAVVLLTAINLIKRGKIR